MRWRHLCYGALAFASTACGAIAADSGAEHPDATVGDDGSAAVDAGEDAFVDGSVDAGLCAQDNDPSPACEPAQQANVLTQMEHAPISPNHAALLDLNPCDAGLTIDAATYVLCAPMQIDNGPDAGLACWGTSCEATLSFDPATSVANGITLSAGYVGTLTFKSPDGQSTYVVGTNRDPITKNGAPFPFPGSAYDAGADGGPEAAAVAAADELYRGLLATFAPSIALDPAGTTCQSTGKCILGFFGDITYFYVPALGLAIWTPNVAADPAGITRIDVYRVALP